MSGFRSGPDALRRMFQFIDRPIDPTAIGLDRTTHQPGFTRQADGFCSDFRLVAKTILQIGAHPKLRTYHDLARDPHWPLFCHLSASKKNHSPCSWSPKPQTIVAPESARFPRPTGWE